MNRKFAFEFITNDALYSITWKYKKVDQKIIYVYGVEAPISLNFMSYGGWRTRIDLWIGFKEFKKLLFYNINKQVVPKFLLEKDWKLLQAKFHKSENVNLD